MASDVAQASTAVKAEGESAAGMGRMKYELRFDSLFNPGRGLSFPCDEQGHVEMNELSDRARDNYLYARAVVGKQYAFPRVLLIV